MAKHRASGPGAADFDDGHLGAHRRHRRLHRRRPAHPDRHPRPARDGDHRPGLVHRLRRDRAPRRRNPPASSVELRIKTATVDTGVADRDAHLRSPDFLDVETYPELTFVSTEVEQLDEDTYRVTGDLTIKDVTRPVSVDFTLTGSARDPWGQLRVGFEGALVIRRSDWGLTWNTALDTGGVLVSDKIQIEFDVSAIRTS